MDIIESHDGQTGVLAISGRLDTSGAPALAPRAITLCDIGIRALLIDLQQVDYLTSAGFRALIAIRRHTEQASIGMALCGLNDVVHDLFEVSGLLGRFRIYSDRASALAGIAKTDPAWRRTNF
jgi:anti-anti-sigma factor